MERKYSIRFSHIINLFKNTILRSKMRTSRNTQYKLQEPFGEEIKQRIYRPFVAVGSVRLGTINIPIDGRGRRGGKTSCRITRYCYLLEAVFENRRGDLTHFGELCKWDLVKPNSLSTGFSLSPHLPLRFSLRPPQLPSGG